MKVCFRNSSLFLLWVAFGREGCINLLNSAHFIFGSLSFPGFTFVKELTLDVKNVIAPPKPKSSLVREKASPLDEDAGKPSADADTDAKIDKVPNHGQAREVSDTESAHGHQQTARSPTDSPSRSNAVESPSKEFQESMYGKDVNFDGSPHAAPR